MARHELRSRRPTTTCQKEPNEYREKIVDFIIFVEQQRRKFNYQHIYAADETAVYIDFSNSLTVEKRGAKEVRALHFSHCSRSGVNWFGKIGFGFKNFKVLKNRGFRVSDSGSISASGACQNNWPREAAHHGLTHSSIRWLQV